MREAAMDEARVAEETRAMHEGSQAQTRSRSRSPVRPGVTTEGQQVEDQQAVDQQAVEEPYYAFEGAAPGSIEEDGSSGFLEAIMWLQSQSRSRHGPQLTTEGERAAEELYQAAEDDVEEAESVFEPAPRDRPLRRTRRPYGGPL
ncbi:hypothetical protein PG984_010388 [Apiospora sp. TS-2023a]